MQKILVVGPSWVGDMVMAQSLFKALKASHLPCQVDVLAPDWSMGLLHCMPEVHRAIANPLKHGVLDIALRKKIGKELSLVQYDQAIVLPNSFKSALIPWFAKIPCRTGWLGEMRWGLLNDVRRLNQKQYPKMVERFVALGYPRSQPSVYSKPQLHIDEKKKEAVLQKFNVAGLPLNIFGICPGAEYGPSKRWPASYFKQVIDTQIERGWNVWLFGSPKDDHKIYNENPMAGFRNFIGKTNLEEVVLLLSCCQKVLTNDSGLMHVASALDTSVVALYGSSDKNFTPPLSTKAHILSLDLPCSPCFKRRCPKEHTRCLNDLKPEYIQEILEKS